MKKTKKEIKVKEIPSPPKSIAPLSSNIVTGYSHEDIVVLDFGFYAPSYIENAGYIEDSQVARLCLTWNTAEALYELLSDILKSHPSKKGKNKPRTSRR